ncbi:MAG: ATP-binding protein, partial [Candidatus Latescibacterota bacterium]
SIKDYIPLALKNEKFKKKQSEIIEDVKQRKAQVTEKFEREVNERGFSLIEVEYGPFTRPEIAPVVGGEVVSMDALPSLMAKDKLGQGDFQKFQNGYPELMAKLEEVVGVARDLQRELADRLVKLEREHIGPIVEFSLNEVRNEFPDEKIDTYLDGLYDHIMDNLGMFHRGEQGDEPEMYREDLIPFEVNLLVDNSKTKKAPVIIETAPTFVNLFGTIERAVDAEGETLTDFTAIRAGSILRANGGYLVLNLTDVLEEPHAWTTLKRTLKHQKLTIRGFDSLLLVPIAALKPEAIDLDVKIVLIGDAYSYQVLYEYDEDFGKIFKVKAEFDRVMPNRKRNVTKYCQFIRNLSAEEGLKPFHKTGAAAIVEEGVRLAARKDKISTRFSDIGDVIRESSYWAGKDGSKSVRQKHVAKAVEERERRVSLYEDKIQEMITDGTILLDIEGAKVGQVNGLTVFDIGDYTFGRPARITVETGVGRSGLINVEREADMSGRTYNKGVLILDGYIRRMYAQDKPVTMNASICFEQSYSGIDGDSASSTEIYGLLSSLAEVPLRQDIAVTGSVNQKGEIQPIGGVNEKIEGFYEVCSFKGLSGEQGVLIPARNKVDVMLSKNIVNAVQAGRFHIYAINTIDEGIEILTGIKAGRRRKDGKFDKDSVHGRVDERLRRFHEQLSDSEDSTSSKDPAGSKDSTDSK